MARAGDDRLGFTARCYPGTATRAADARLLRCAAGGHVAFMFDRVISGAGAVTDAADRMVRALGRGGGEGFLGHRPGSVAVAVVCAVLAGILVFAGLEATDNPTALAMTPTQVAAATTSGTAPSRRSTGSIAATYVETYTDDNGNGTQDAGEDGISWFYFLVDPEHEGGRHRPLEVAAGQAVHVRGGRHRRDRCVLRRRRTSATSPKRRPRSGSRSTRRATWTRRPLSDGAAPLVDLAGRDPDRDDARSGCRSRGPAGTSSSVPATRTETGPVPTTRSTGGTSPCSIPMNGNAITVLVDKNPEYTKATFTGMLRRDERRRQRSEDDRRLRLQHDRPRRSATSTCSKTAVRPRARRWRSGSPRCSACWQPRSSSGSPAATSSIASRPTRCRRPAVTLWRSASGSPSA